MIVVILATKALFGQRYAYVSLDPKMSSYPGDTVEITYKLSEILKCGLSREQVEVCISLLESGISPEALVHIVRELPEALVRRRQQ
jgi:hypothetical protein